MNQVTSSDKRVEYDYRRAAVFIEETLGVSVSTPFMGIIVRRGLAVIGAVILNGYEPGRNIDVTVAGRGAFGLREVREIARFVFETLDCPRATMITDISNQAAMRAARAIGFKSEGFLRCRFGDDKDGLLFGLTRKEQKLIRRKEVASTPSP